MGLAGFSDAQLQILTKILGDKHAETAALNEAVSRLQAALELVRQRIETGFDDLTAEAATLAAASAELKQVQMSMLGPYGRDEIKYQLAARRRTFASPQQRIGFDLICVDLPDPSVLTRRDLYLDDQTLDRHYADSYERIGVIKTNSTWRFVNRGVVRMSRMLGRRFAASLNLPAELLTESLFYSIANELPRLIPARHLARRLARLSGGEPVLIPLNKKTFTYICGHELEPFYLAAELQRLRVPVAQCRSSRLRRLPREERPWSDRVFAAFATS
jgi:hypothetical protein